MATDKANRIFWLGMHVVLTQTELPRLRSLGYEVFNPPYLADVYDQSAVTKWNPHQNSTLPAGVFLELSQHNFFYNKITPRIAELLNEYFGTVIVTINPEWLESVMRVYKGRVIYRAYGQLGTLSDSLWLQKMFCTIQEYENFVFVPHAEEAVREEHSWLKERMQVVPYIPTMDIFQHENSWDPEAEHRHEIMVSCPNISNKFYADQYNHLNVHFPERYFRLYGVQKEPVADPRVVGTLPRDEFMSRYRESAGLFYHYDLPNVCHLPPIEMMIVGGPVIYQRGSLLSKFLPGGPGEAENREQARRKIRLLLAGDKEFIADVRAAQEDVVRRYHPDHVWPQFDQTFRTLLKSEPTPRVPTVLRLNDAPPDQTRSRAYVLFHFPGHIISFSKGLYQSAEGIPRAISKMVESLLKTPDRDVVVTCFSEQLPNAYGYFDGAKNGSRVRFQVLDHEALNQFDTSGVGFLRRVNNRLRIISQSVQNGISRVAGALKTVIWKAVRPIGAWILRPEFIDRIAKKLLVGDGWPLLFLGAVLMVFLQAYRLTMRGVRLGRRIVGRLKYEARGMVRRLRQLIFDAARCKTRLRFVKRLNDSDRKQLVVIPHYFLFPESLLLRNPLMLFLPDFMPHFFPEAFARLRDRLNTYIGRVISRKSKSIFTCSEYTRAYLPGTQLRVDDRKVSVIPMPFLSRRNEPLSIESTKRLEKKLKDETFLFYPTQNRPNKQIAFLLQVFAGVREERPDLKLVLTCDLGHHPPAAHAYAALNLEGSIIFLPGASDAEMAWLYNHAAALCLTSTMEGNFPPQVFEALTFGTPVVATRLPMIEEMLGDRLDDLLTCSPLDRVGFMDALAIALDQPDMVRERQKSAYSQVLDHASDTRFGESVVKLVEKVAA